MRLLVVLMACSVSPAALLARGSHILLWNAALVEAVRAETTPPPLAVRNLAIAHLALREACESGRGRTDVLTAISGCVVASSLFPGQRARFENLRESMLADVDPAATPDEWSSAVACASNLLRSRAGDGASCSVTYIPQATPGQWRRTPPYFRPPELPQWRAVRPFSVTDPTAFAPAGPPTLESGAWIAALDEIARLGGKESPERTAEQTVIARFWSDFSYTSTPPGHWNDIAAGIARDRGFDEATNARLFAILNVAMADAGLVCWQAKYRHNFWRPVTALASEAWEPLLDTPAHPEYPSGHGAFSGAAAAVLAVLLGSDACEFTVRSDGLPGVERVFHSFSAAADEISLSRVYGGIHYRFSCDDGLRLGRAVAAAVLASNHIQATPAYLTEITRR